MYVHVHQNIFSYDEYRHVRYEKKNDHHVYHDATTVALPSGCSTISSETLAQLVGDLGGVQVAWWAHTRTCGPCVE